MQGRTSERKSSLKLLYGRLASALGVLIALPGLFFINQVTLLSFLGILLGAIGFGLGARRFGIAAVIISAVILLFGLAAINGLIPGLNPPGYSDQNPLE